MDTIAQLMNGFSLALTPTNFALGLAGVFLGQIVGALPGIGPTTAIALLLPLTFGAEPAGALIMFAGIYTGSQYGGTITSVLVNVPGESSGVMTAVEGYQMARQGRGGIALGIAAIGSFIAGTIGVVGLMFLAPSLANVALKFGPPEYFSVIVLGLLALAAVGDSVIKGLAMGVFGLLISTIGIDTQTGTPRFYLGQLWLLDGIDFIVLAVALFGLGEVFASCGRPAGKILVEKIDRVLPSWADWQASRWSIARGTVIGFVIGVLPGAGATIASFASYIIEKKVAKDPSRFGSGAIEGVAGPEAANNSAVAGAFVPMFALGIPGSGATAIMLGAFLMFGLRPGPDLFTSNAHVVWAIVASMFIANAILLILNLPLAGVFARLLRLPYSWIYPPIVVICIAGVYSQANSVEDCWVMLAFGVMGWLMKKYNWPAAPIVLGIVLGPLFEAAFHQSMTLSHGSVGIFFTRPISATVLALGAVAVLSPLLLRLLVRTKREVSLS